MESTGGDSEESPRDCSLRTIPNENLSDSFDEEGMREA
jgi:hypothetical protein